MNGSVGSRLKYFCGIGCHYSLGVTLPGEVAQRYTPLFGDGPAPFFLGLAARELEELDACCSNGMQPVVGALGG